MIYTALAFCIGLIVGAYLCLKILNFHEKFLRNQRLQDINNQFKQLLDNIRGDKSKFKSRYGSTVYIQSSMEKWGEVDVVYLLDKKDIAVFKEHKCILTTESVESKVVEEITKEIDTKFHDNINDVIDIMGISFSREDFEKTFNVQFEEFVKNINKVEDLKSQLSDIEKIVITNDQKFDIDEILDKISVNGIESLTDIEKEFLDKFSNGKGN